MQMVLANFAENGTFLPLDVEAKIPFKNTASTQGRVRPGKEKENKIWKEAPSLHRTGRGSQWGSVAVLCTSVLPCRCPSFIIIIHFHCCCPPWIKAHSMTSPNERERGRKCHKKQCVSVGLSPTPLLKVPPLTPSWLDVPPHPSPPRPNHTLGFFLDDKAHGKDHGSGR